MKIISLLWKIYFIVLTLIYVAGHVFALMARPGVFQYLDVIPSIVGLLGLFGYAFHKAILNPLLWKIVFIVVLLWNLYYSGYVGWVELASRDWHVIISFVLAFLIMVPHFLALYLYGFRAQAIWESSKAATAEELTI